MRTGRLSISRGHQLLAERAAAPSAPAEAPVQPVSFSPCRDKSELHLIQVRLNALERLTRLVEQGTISLDEFKLEKSLVLRLTGEELLLTQRAPQADLIPKPSLVGRLAGWRSLLVALIAAGGVQLWAQPEASAAWAAEVTRLVIG